MRGPCLLFRKSNVYTHDVAVLGNESSLWKHTGSLSSCFTIILFELSLIKKKCCQTWSPFNTAVPWGEPVSKEKMKIPSPELEKNETWLYCISQVCGPPVFFPSAEVDRGSQCSSVVRPRGKLQDSQAPWIVTVPTHKLLDVFIEIDFFFRKYTYLKSVLLYTPIEQLRVSCACEECALCEVRGHSVLQKAPTCPCSQSSQVPASPPLNHTSVVTGE